MILPTRVYAAVRRFLFSQSVSLTPAQREELDRRLEDYRQHPGEGSPWEEVRSRILASAFR